MFGAEILAVPTVCTAIIILTLAMWFEARTDRIPNWLSVLGLISGIVLTTVDQLFLSHVCGLLFGFVFGVTFFIFRIAGGGAAKLMMAIGAVIGPAGPIASAAVSLLILGYTYLLYKVQPASEMCYESEVTGPTTTSGSLIIALGTAIGVAVLGKPWEYLSKL